VAVIETRAARTESIQEDLVARTGVTGADLPPMSGWFQGFAFANAAATTGIWGLSQC
jgi:hypothetical protein